MSQEWFRLDLRFLRSHPAHWVALGFGSGLVRGAPGTAGTLLGWGLFVLLSPWMTDWLWGLVLLVSLPLGWWACSVTAQHMDTPDPGSIVWDEIVAIWLILLLVMPTGFWGQFAAFVLFRFFDSIKLGPVAWADRLCDRLDLQNDPRAWKKAGFYILLDDIIAAGCTLLVIALWQAHALNGLAGLFQTGV